MFAFIILVLPLFVSGDWVRPRGGTTIINGGNSSGGGGNATPGGSDTQVQFNDNNNFNGSQDFTFNKTSKSATLNSTFVNTYTIGDPVLDNDLITYTDLVGDNCVAQNDFTNTGTDTFSITIKAYNITGYGYVASAVPIVKDYVGDGVSDDCWNFYINWSDVPSADFYQVAGSYYGDGLNIDGGCVFPTDSETSIYSSTSWTDCVTAFDSPYNYVSYTNGVNVLGDALISHNLNVSNSIFGYNDLKICSGATCAVVTKNDAYNYGNGIIMSIAGSPRLCYQAGSDRLCIDYDSGGMRFILDSSMQRLMFASPTEYDIFTAGVQTYQIKSGKITEYGDVATEGWGTPSIVDDVSLTARNTSVSNTAFTNANAAGLYRVNYYLEDTTALLTAGTVQLLVNFTDGAGATSVSSAALPLTVLGRTSGIFYVHLASGSISYSTILVGTTGTAKYALYMSAERLK